MAFFWGSTGSVALGSSEVLGVFARSFGLYDSKVYQTVMANLNYSLGINPLQFSYVSGYGDNSLKHVYSNIYNYDGIAEIPPGYVAGGANHIEGKYNSRFAGKSYADTNSDWTMNEQAIYWNASLVYAVAQAVDGIHSPPVDAINIPSSPAHIAATAGDSHVYVSWDAAVGATSYQVRRGTVSGAATVPIATVTGATYAYDDLNVTNGTTYYYTVTASNGAGTSAPSQEASATPAATTFN